MKHLFRTTRTPSTFRSSSSLLYQSVHSLVTSIFSIAISLISSIAIARGFGPTVKGSADLVITTSALLVMFFGLSLQSGIVYVVAQKQAAINRLLMYLTIIALFQTLLATTTVIGLAQTPLSSTLIPPNSGVWGIIAISILVLANLLASYYRSVLMGLQEIPLANVTNLVGQIVTLSVLLIVISAAWFQRQQLTVQVLISVQISSAIGLALLLRLTLRPWLTDSTQQKSGIVKVAKFSIPWYLINTVQFLNYRLDIFFVSYFVGVTGVGLYSLAVSIAQLIWLISGTLSQVLFPDIAASADRIDAQKRVARASRISLWLSVLLALGLALSGDVLLPLVYGNAFRESVAALLWLLPGVAIFNIANIIGAYVAGIDKPLANIVGSLIGLVVTIVLDFMLIPQFGIVGAAIASSASYIATTLVMVVFFIHDSKISFLEILLVTIDDLRALSISTILARRKV